MSRIQTTFDAIAFDLKQSARYPNAAGDEVAPDVLLGGEHVAENAAFPRVVFVPTRGPVVMSDRSSQGPNHLHSWELQYLVYCWGGTFDGAFDIMEGVLRAVRGRITGSYVVTEATFMEANADPLAFGRALLFPLTIRHPIVAAPAETAMVDAAPVTPSFVQL